MKTLGSPYPIFGSFKDVTKEKILQNQLIRSERLVASGKLAASIAHEINSPLQGITALINTMERTCKKDEVLSGNLDLLKGGFESIRDTVKKLLDLNRPGIETEDVERIFDPFYSRKKKMGMGIGLSICHEIIEEHNGFITAENSPEGGAVFTIRLPLA